MARWYSGARTKFLKEQLERLRPLQFQAGGAVALTRKVVTMQIVSLQIQHEEALAEFVSEFAVAGEEGIPAFLPDPIGLGALC